jgi:serine/threonine protein kinase
MARETLGNYELLAQVGEGGAGKVYKARDRATGQLVAVKVLGPEMAARPVILQRFRQEFQSASALQHPNLVRALAFGIDKGRPYLVMEYVDGESLGERVERGGRLPEEEALDYVCQVCEGLHHAHQRGVIHRDVKPDNVLVTADGRARLTDLGLVKKLDSDVDLTRTGGGLGTPHFMAPEQFRNAKHADVRSDVYALGATLYQLVTGELPFAARGPVESFMRKQRGDLRPARQVAPEVSELTDVVIRWAVQPEPARRPRSCRELSAALSGAVAVPEAVVKQAPPGEPLGAWKLVLCAAGAAVAAAVGGLFLFRGP